MSRATVTAVFLSGAVLGASAVMAAARGRMARARVDELTSVFNRAGLVAQWPSRVWRTAAVLDLDGFKPVNDRYGHAAGDVVLTTVASRLSAGVPGGLVARLGGDEFAVLLGCDVGQAYRLAVRLAAGIAAPVVVPGGYTVMVTASIGLAPVDGLDLSAVLALADAAMYRAKASRCGVAVYDPAVDDRTSVPADPRPAVRLRDLPVASWPAPARLPA